MGVSFVIIFGSIGGQGQGEMEDSPAVRIRRRPQATAMGLDDRVADRKAYAHASGFGRYEGLE